MKKILDHLRQNWMKYGFETLVVVTGVLGAFSLNNWNEQQKSNREELVVLKEMLEEFKYNKYKLNDHLSYLDQRRSPTLALYKMYDVNPESIDINDFDSLYAATFYYKSFHVGQAVMNDIINSGRFSLVRNDSIRLMITGWPGLLSKAYEEDQNLYEFNEDAFKYSLDFFSWRNTDKYDLIMSRYQQGNSKLKPDNRSILYSFEFENRVGQLLWYIDNCYEEYVQLGSHMDKIIRLLRAEMELHE